MEYKVLTALFAGAIVWFGSSPAEARSIDPIGDIIRAAQAREAGRPKAVQPTVRSATYDDDKRVALIYVEDQLGVTDPGCAAYDSLLIYHDELMSDEIEPSALRDLAAEGRRLEAKQLAMR